ncbi:hypothetical protein FRC04_011299 [Tulasnella sp. 424]|nr:hypothetical protein FRC04_011299 [Tulasnella sp. 424]KAG8971835.1 hypothetical protein FRC05_010796 [Tulasnella sp. 425]
MATTDDGIQLTIQLNGSSYSRTYHKSDAVNNVIVLGRLSSTSPDVRFPAWSSLDHQAEVYISDPPNHSHHGTYLSRNGRTFRVDQHPQPLQTGDIVTFGKTVHRGGQVYEPLSARVRMLSMDTTHQSFASYTGHGYSLPPNIDIDVDIEEDHEVYKDDEIEEHPSTHKFYTVQEVQDDGDEDGSIPSPLFPRGPDARQGLPPLMPGGFHSIPEASPFSFNISPQSCLFEPPAQVAGYLPNALSNPPQVFGPFLTASGQSPLPLLGSIFRGAPPSLPPILPPLAQSRVRSPAPNPAHLEVIDVDKYDEEREIIDVDADGSPDSSVREASPFDDDSRSSVEDSDSEFQTNSRSVSPATSAAESGNLSTQNRSEEEVEKLKDVLRMVKDSTNKLIAYKNQSKRRIVANKVQLDSKIASLEQDITLLRSKVEAEHQGFSSVLEKRKTEAMEDIDTRKSGFMDDLNVYEDDVTYEVDRVMDCVEELNVKAGEGKTKVDEYVESVRRLKEELEVALRAQIDEIRAKGAGAAEEINEVVAGVKRKREASEEVEEAQPRARSPSVAMSMSPEPESESESELNAAEVETTTGRGNITSTKDNLTPDPLPMMEEPPHKRQKLDMKDAQGAQAGRILGALAATTVAVCWVLGKIGEMSTLGDV